GSLSLRERVEVRERRTTYLDSSKTKEEASNMDIDLSRFSGPVIQNEIELEDRLTGPTPDVVRAVSELEGDLMILGVGGKMGPTLAVSPLAQCRMPD
ncbi:MAG TPA: hypothetical protein PLZ55_19910, partial [bacterium]|nr:hypothetical protein [bacterium]